MAILLRTNVEMTSTTLYGITKDLETHEYMMVLEYYEANESLKIHKLDIATLRKSFEECAIQLHHYTPHGETDKGIFCSLIRVIARNFLKHYKRSSKIENNNNNSNDESDYLVQTNSINSRISMDLSTG
ncbi:hypothetical protein Glove_71g71 [Diversispora epigaea]|uniref:Serine-threonine/tyrosine-protein kinase catalytic domain-containing protein n=1 Tax=Diversispora epigaea TaxID=1348612 RepID=A0A397J9N5_9GLOM|nr:hypothetical protein Glove_71g71 [Diversispora epigaea]